MAKRDKSQVSECLGEEKKEEKKKDDRGRTAAFLVYADSAPADWIERMKGLHVRGFISPCHDRDVLADGSPKKAHWHVLWLFDGKKSRAQVDALRELALGSDYNSHLEEIGCIGAYVRYLVHMDDPDKARYDARDVVSLGGADFELASSMPGDDSVIMASISAYVIERDIVAVNDLIGLAQAEGRKDWLDYISRRGYVIGMIIGDNRKRLTRIRDGKMFPRDCAVAD